MELFVFIVFQLLMEVQSNNAPTVHVSPAVFTESRSVKISCETPADVKVKKCDFTINRKKLETKVSPSCELNLTGVEALRWADEKSPQSVNIACCYTIKGRRGNRSSDSVPVTVTVLDKLQKPFINVSEDGNHLNIACEIPLSVRADFTCSFYYEDDAILVNRDSQWSSSGEKHLCSFNPTLSELLRRSVKSKQMSCDYSLKSEPDIRSPHSDTHIIGAASTLPSTSETTQLYSTVADHYSKTNLSTSRTNQTTCKDSTTNLPTSTAMQNTTDSTVHASTDQPTTTNHTGKDSTTNLPTSTAMQNTTDSTVHASTDQPTTTKHTDTWVKVLAFSCAGVILSVFICLSWFARKIRRKRNKMKSVKTYVFSQGNGMSCSGSPEIYSLITSVPATSQPTSDDLEHPESHQQNTADPTDTFTFHQPSDVSVHKQQQGNTEENESVYHLYCTIPDKPVQPYTGDQVYSLIQMH